MMTEFIAYLESHSGFFVALGGIATACAALFGLWRRSKGQNDRLHDQLDAQNRKLNECYAEIAKTAQQKEHVEDDLKKAIAREQQAKIEMAEARGRYEATVAELGQMVETHKEAANESTKSLASMRNKIKHTLELDGQIWARRPLARMTPFKPLAERRTPIISVLNLKGGVGKTTLVANLAAALSAKGYRVLMVDLDLQGSLTSYFLRGDEIRAINDAGLGLRSYLTESLHAGKASIKPYAVTALNDKRLSLVPTSDRLAYAEMNLTLSWLLDLTRRRDARALLRKGLHLKSTSAKYDIILLDCPPIMNTCCVNALVASDYLLIPAVPTQKSVDRIPYLLRACKEVANVLNPDLNIMGAVLNRTHGREISYPEQTLWSLTLDKGKDQLGVPLHGFSTVIPRSNEFRDSEEEFTLPEPGSVRHEVFRALAEEVEERLPNECRRLAVAPN